MTAAGVILCDDRKDFHLGLIYIIKYANLSDAQSILRLSHRAQSRDAAFACLTWLKAQMDFEGITNSAAIRCAEPLQIFNRFGRENDFMRHSGQMIAR